MCVRVYIYIYIFPDFYRYVHFFLKKRKKKTPFLVTHIANHFFHLAFTGSLPDRSATR